jgi:hypothetical protein
LAPDHPDVATWHSSLGNALADLAGARTQLERALEIAEATLGPNHPNVVLFRRILQQLGSA